MLKWVNRCALLAILVAVTVTSPANAQFGWGIVSNDSPWSRAGVITPPVHAGQERSIEAHVPLKRLPEIAPAAYSAPLAPPLSVPGIASSPRQSFLSMPAQTSPSLEIPPSTTASELTSPRVETLPDTPWQATLQQPQPIFHLTPEHHAEFHPPIVPPGAVGLNYQTPAGAAPVGATWFELPCSRVDRFHLDFLGRAAFENDQRIEWSGVEATFGAEGSILAGAREDLGMFTTGLETEILVNQPFDRNILVDTAERRSYLGNWDIEPVQLSQLYLTARRNEFMVAVGKMTTPFGRAYFPLYENDRSDGPFIRTESILWRETGLLLQWDPGNWVMTASLMNGGPERDSNSSKALIARVGYEDESMAFGGSIKRQDGIGSEHQKQFTEHVGLDGMVRRGPWTLSGELIYDIYGLRQPYDPLNITWGRSIYYRDQNLGLYQPITGVGYYVNLGYSEGHWTTMLNYGEFIPAQIGDPRHDITNRRAIAKVIWHFRSTDTYLMCLWENDVPGAQDGRLRKGIDVLTGFQLAL